MDRGSIAAVVGSLLVDCCQQLLHALHCLFWGCLPQADRFQLAWHNFPARERSQEMLGVMRQLRKKFSATSVVMHGHACICARAPHTITRLTITKYNPLSNIRRRFDLLSTPLDISEYPVGGRSGMGGLLAWLIVFWWLLAWSVGFASVFLRLEETACIATAFTP